MRLDLLTRDDPLHYLARLRFGLRAGGAIGQEEHDLVVDLRGQRLH
jgi:hypothetical protein